MQLDEPQSLFNIRNPWHFVSVRWAGSAPNLENAKLFMNFMLKPENAAALTNFASYTAGVEGTEPYLDIKFIGAPEMTPPAGAPKPEFVPPCAPEVVKLYDRIWTNLLK